MLVVVAAAGFAMTRQSSSAEQALAPQEAAAPSDLLVLGAAATPLPERPSFLQAPAVVTPPTPAARVLPDTSLPSLTSAGAAAVNRPVGVASAATAPNGRPDNPLPAAEATPTVQESLTRAQATATASPTLPPLDLSNPATPRASALASAPQPTPPPEPTEVLIVHEVRPGDTLSTIAQRYRVTVASLLANNAVVNDRDMLKVGLQLMVPAKEGVLYFVRLGDTVTDIAKTHNIKPEDIVNFAPNRLGDANQIREGELILLPGGQRPAPPPPPPTPTPTPTPAPAPTRTPAPAAAIISSGAAQATPARPPTAAAVTPAQSAGGWIWPIKGPLSSYFGSGHPLGIDIDLYGRAGAPIVASRGGTVTFAGGNPCCSYGYYVEIDHGDGYRTIYAHFNTPPPVRIGQIVNQGQVVGYAGTTGYSTGVHLHFEIRRSGTPLNPLGFLP